MVNSDLDSGFVNYVPVAVSTCAVNIDTYADNVNDSAAVADYHAAIVSDCATFADD